MTTVAQMIEWMKTLPQDAVVECGCESNSGYSTYMTMSAVEIDACSVIDCSSTKGKIFVELRANES